MTTSNETLSPATLKKMKIASWVLTGLTTALFLFSASGKLLGGEEAAKGFTEEFGYPGGVLPIIAAIELLNLVLYLVPKTSILGAILTTGYLGGAVASHVRIADGGWPAAVVVGVVIWIALWLRDADLRKLTPFRR